MTVAGAPALARRLGGRRWELALVAVTAVWGWTFVVVQDAVATMPPLTFVGYRFALAAVILAALPPRAPERRSSTRGLHASRSWSLGRAGVRRRYLTTSLPGERRGPAPGLGRAGVLAGVALFAGYAFQTVGLQYTTASSAGFITGMMVVITPLLGALLLREHPGRWPAAGAALAAGGLALLSLRELQPRGGDLLVLACAVSFAGHILLLGRFAPRFDTHRLAVVQLATVAALALAWAALAGDLALPASASVVAALAITGVLATSVAFWVQTRAQRRLSPTRTAVILTMEPVFAGLFGYLLAGERIGARGWLGAALIVAGMLAATVARRPGHWNNC